MLYAATLARWNISSLYNVNKNLAAKWSQYIALLRIEYEFSMSLVFSLTENDNCG